MRYIFVIAVCFGLLGGCATIPEEQCAKVDWYELGVQDGRAGYPADRLLQHRDACAGVKVIPDEKRYLQGRPVGLADSKRNQLRSEIRDLDRRRESLRDDLFTAERELDRIPKGPAAAW